MDLCGNRLSQNGFHDTLFEMRSRLGVTVLGSMVQGLRFRVQVFELEDPPPHQISSIEVASIVPSQQETR